jgi:thiamine-phosphate pyrophosphorylase
LDAKLQWEELRKALLASADNGGWPLICVNDRADLAMLASLEGLAPWGLHLGQGDLPPSEARRLQGLENVHLGTSTNSPAEWDNVDPVCDHAGVGPMRATPSKADHAGPIGFEGLRIGCQALRAHGVAPIAIGGVGREDMATCFEAGAESLAMIAAIQRAENPSDLLYEAQVVRWRVRPPVKRGQGIVLAGGSGAGKTTLARALAARSGMEAIDLDDRIAERAGRDIPRIFAELGEQAFRDLEAELASEYLSKPVVLALGGGAWERAEIREAVQKSGFAAMWLAEVPNRAWARVGSDPGRPLAQDRATFMARWRSRMARWPSLPAILPLGHSAEDLADAMSL